MKNIYILLIFICSMANVQAQNSELAKAFYTKAETAYKANNYEEALQLLEKCKEQLNGETNPEIMYLEAKTRYVIDKNINETKRLMNSFIKDAYEDDERIPEIAGILSDIELSSNFYSNGQKKILLNDSEGLKIHYLENGQKLVEINAKSNTELHYNTEGNVYRKITEKPSDRTKQIIEYTNSGEFSRIINYDRDVPISALYYIDGKLRKTIIETESARTLVSIFNEIEDLIQRYEYRGNKLYEFESFGEAVKHKTRYNSATILEFNTSSLPVNLIDEHKELNSNFITSFKIDYWQERYKYLPDDEIYYFDEYGIPVKNETYSRGGRLKKTYFFDKNLNRFVEQ